MHGPARCRQKHLLPAVETSGLRSGALQTLRTIPDTGFRNVVALNASPEKHCGPEIAIAISGKGMRELSTGR